MSSHISRQDDADKSLSERLKVIPRELFQEVIVSLVEESERLGSVEVFLNTLIAVADGTLRDLVHMVSICEPIVTKVVANRTDAQ